MGISSAVDGTSVEVLYASGAAPGQPDGALRNSKDTSGVAGAAALAARADVAIVVVGLEEHFEEEGTDRMDPSTNSGGNGLFQLPGAQQQLVDAVVATKTPVVQVLINGGPLSLKAPSSTLKFALVEAFYGAQSCGDGIADVIFGATPPAGKMPVTAYASPEQAGNITDMDMSQGRTYRYLQGEPVYAFGFGLSYTTWEYASLRTNSSGSVLPTSAVGVTMSVTNTGAIDSAQVIQLYAALSSDFASIPANVSRHVPVRQLVAFQKIFVKSGESRDVSMALVPDQLAGWNLFQHANRVKLHLAAGDVSPTSKTLSRLQKTSIDVGTLTATMGGGLV